jgi:hypothetical protein
MFEPMKSAVCSVTGEATGPLVSVSLVSHTPDRAPQSPITSREPDLRSSGPSAPSEAEAELRNPGCLRSNCPCCDDPSDQNELICARAENSSAGGGAVFRTSSSDLLDRLSFHFGRRER